MENQRNKQSLGGGAAVDLKVHAQQKRIRPNLHLDRVHHSFVQSPGTKEELLKLAAATDELVANECRGFFTMRDCPARRGG